MNITRILAGALILASSITLTACGQKETKNEQATPADSVTVDTTAVEPATADNVVADAPQAPTQLTSGMSLKEVAAIPGVQFIAAGDLQGASCSAWIYVKYEGKDYPTTVEWTSMNDSEVYGLTPSGKSKWDAKTGNEMFPEGQIDFTASDFTPDAQITK